MSNNIEGKVIVITGASSGLGEATSRLLCAQGASVVLGARRADRLQALTDELISSGGKAHAVTTDVTDRDQVKRLVDAAVQQFGRINIRTTVISPGAVATESPNSVNDPVVAERIQKFYKKVAIPAESFARIVAFAVSQPEDVDINETCSGSHARSCNPSASNRSK